jgi:hypothetical protein
MQTAAIRVAPDAQLAGAAHGEPLDRFPVGRGHQQIPQIDPRLVGQELQHDLVAVAVLALEQADLVLDPGVQPPGIRRLAVDPADEPEQDGQEDEDSAQWRNAEEANRPSGWRRKSTESGTLPRAA